jgi:hypothetical protein
MENKKHKCSFKEHNELDANIYCQKCDKFLCNKCGKYHLGLFPSHQPISLEKDISQVFTGLCKVENHQIELDYYCKTHNELCCAKCVAFKRRGNGQHNGCDICNISKLPLRSNHCPICQKCVKGFDHHFWILAGCIGEKNHSNFIVFLFFQNISLICSCFGIIKIINYQDKEILEYFLTFYFSIICLIEVFFIFIFCYHIFLLLSNQTTYEIFNEDECPYLSAFTYERNKILCQRGIQVNNDARYRPFDAGIIANIFLFIIKLFNSDYPIRWDDIFLDNLKTNR